MALLNVLMVTFINFVAKYTFMTKLIRVNDDTHKKIKTFAADKGIKMEDAVALLIKGYVVKKGGGEP